MNPVGQPTNTQWFFQPDEGIESDQLAEIFARMTLNDLREVSQVSQSWHNFTVRNTHHHMLSLADMSSSIDDETVKAYQDRQKLAGKELSFEEALASCLRTKHALSRDPSNPLLREVHVSNCQLTPELIEAFKKYGTGLHTLSLDSVTLPDGVVGGFSEMTSRMAELEHLSIVNCNINEALNLSAMPKLQTLKLENCQHLGHEPDLTQALQLKELSLSRCGHIVTAPVIPNGSQMKRLDLYSTGIVNPPDLTHASALEVLDLTLCDVLNQAPVIPPGSQLKQLYLENCIAITQPPNLDHAIHLQLLNVKGCTGLRGRPVVPQGRRTVVRR